MSTQFTFIYVHPEAPGDINDGLVIYQGSRLYDPTPFMTVRAMVVSNKRSRSVEPTTCMDPGSYKSELSNC